MSELSVWSSDRLLLIDNEDLALGVRALAWLSGQPELPERFLAATGVGPDTVRDRAREPAFLAAALDFIGYDDAGFAACAAALEVTPERLAAAARALAGGEGFTPRS